MRKLLSAALLFAASSAGLATAASLDVSDPAAYESAHRTLAEALRADLQSRHGDATVRAELTRHGREMALRELCSRCEDTARAIGAGDDYEPGLWLYEPAAAAARTSEVLIAFPPAGDDTQWKQVQALDSNGRWISLDAHTPPKVPVMVLRINGTLSFENQIGKANEMLRAAGLQQPAAKAGTALNGSGRWTTRLESIRLNDDEEPWVSGAAEVYAITAGVLPGNSPQVAVVDMPYLDHDGTTYYPRQVLLDWNQYSFGVANVLLYEHDDNTNYQQLVTLIIQAVGQGGSLFGQPEVAAIAEIAARIVAAMPSGWFSNDDDYVDAIYSVEKARGETRYGAGGNAQVSYIPYELPSN
jgi:hypothetical protein